MQHTDDAEAMADRLLGVVHRAGTYFRWSPSHTGGRENPYLWQILEHYTGQDCVPAMLVAPHICPANLHMTGKVVVTKSELEARGIL